MPQDKTTIRSGNQTLRAYDDEGVLTPASGLDEYKIIQIEGNSKTLELDYPLLVTEVRVSLSSNLASGDDISLSINSFKIVSKTIDEDTSRVVLTVNSIAQNNEQLKVDNNQDIDIDNFTVFGKRIGVV